MNRVQHAPPVEVLTQAVVVVVVVICATILGLHNDLNSGDMLAVYTTAITGVAAVAGARAGNRTVRHDDDQGDTP